jgi:hypothetical protein
MRLTQFGHQVPRRNSTITGELRKASFSVNDCVPFAAGKTKSGARSPSFKVELGIRMSRL